MNDENAVHSNKSSFQWAFCFIVISQVVFYVVECFDIMQMNQLLYCVRQMELHKSGDLGDKRNCFVKKRE